MIQQFVGSTDVCPYFLPHENEKCYKYFSEIVDNAIEAFESR